MRGSRSSRPWICLVIDSRGFIDAPFARRAASFMPPLAAPLPLHLLGADVVVPHDLAPARHLLDDPLLRRLGTERDHVHAKRVGERLVDVRKLDRLYELGME